MLKMTSIINKLNLIITILNANYFITFDNIKMESKLHPIETDPSFARKRVPHITLRERQKKFR